MMASGDDQSMEWEKNTQSNQTSEADPASSLSKKEALEHFGRQFSPVFIPLSFALVTFLFTLPFHAHSQSGVFPLSPLVTGFLLLGLAFVQGLLLFSAGANDTLWVLYIALGYALLIVGGVFAALGVGTALITLALLLVLGLFLARRGIHLTTESHIDLVEAFGRYTHTLYPGLNLLLPWEKISHHLTTQETVWTSPAQRVPVSPKEDIVLTATLSYQLLPEDAYLAILMVSHWEESLHVLFISTIQNVPLTLSLSDFLTAWQESSGQAVSGGTEIQTHWEKINSLLARRIQDRVAGWGVQINWVHIRDVQVIPHDVPRTKVEGSPPGAIASVEQVVRPNQQGTAPLPQTESIFVQLGDSPTTNDLLNFRQYANAVAKNILLNFSEKAEQNEQLTIGVYGEWGSGKTSFMRMVEAALQTSQIHPIWFNAWRYDKEDNLWAALIQRMLDQAAMHEKWYRRAWARFLIWKDSIRLQDGMWEIFKKLFPVIFKLFVFFLGLYVLIGLDTTTLASFLRQWLPNNAIITPGVQASILKVIGALSAAVAAISGPFGLLGLLKGNLGIDFSKFREKTDYRDHLSFLDEFNKELEKIVRVLGRGRKPLVVMIDDLDRCLPEKAIQVIEATKVFLDIKGCVFVLGLDKGIIEKAIASKYKDIFSSPGENNDGLLRRKQIFYEEYIDKFIQLAVILPRLTQSMVEDFVKCLRGDKDIERCAHVFGIGLSPNPRKIKRVLRTFLFVRDMVEKDIQEAHIEIAILAKLVVIQSEMPFLFEGIMENNALIGGLERYYQTRSENYPAEEEKNVPFSELAQKYETLYPQLPQLLLTRMSETDTFLTENIFLYMPIWGFLAVVRPLISQNTINEEVLVKEYNAVRNGTITDPQTIREIAERFQILAQDSKAIISFDAERAARVLYQRADKYEKGEYDE